RSARIFRLVAPRQLRVVPRLLEAVRNRPRRLRDAGADDQGQRPLLLAGHCVARPRVERPGRGLGRLPGSGDRGRLTDERAPRSPLLHAARSIDPGAVRGATHTAPLLPVASTSNSFGCVDTPPPWTFRARAYTLPWTFRVRAYTFGGAALMSARADPRS